MSFFNKTNTTKVIIFTSIFLFCFFIDQYVKYLFVNGLEYKSNYVSFILVYNHGVAFSMLSSISEYLKYLQLSILIAGGVYLYFNSSFIKEYYIPLAFLLAGGLSNISDRFFSINGGVVDYIYYHHWFDFAVFNLADVFIDIAIALILLKQYQEYKKSQNNN